MERTKLSGEKALALRSNKATTVCGAPISANRHQPPLQPAPSPNQPPACCWPSALSCCAPLNAAACSSDRRQQVGQAVPDMRVRPAEPAPRGICRSADDQDAHNGMPGIVSILVLLGEPPNGAQFSATRAKFAPFSVKTNFAPTNAVARKMIKLQVPAAQRLATLSQKTVRIKTRLTSRSALILTPSDQNRRPKFTGATRPKLHERMATPNTRIRRKMRPSGAVVSPHPTRIDTLDHRT